MNKDLNTLETDIWTIRYRLPKGPPPYSAIWLMHGWTGDEDSMWIFASRLPKEFLLLAPRGLYTTPLGGYGWHEMADQKTWPQIADFQPAIEELFKLMSLWPEQGPEADFSRFRIAGFSQGGALAYSIAILHPQKVISVAGLASFLPDGAASFLHPTHLRGMPVFVSHGTKDKLVPVARARQAVQQLDRSGAEVHYCESDVGHKLSADCFRGMEAFYT
jgi:phospholipase/carboxylesterase